MPQKLVCLAIAALSVASASQRALLVGVGKYPSYPGIKALEGPANDVPALKKVLIESWGFREENIHTLLDGAGTRDGILAGIDKLIAETQQGDFVLIYYSGHGTSFHDPKNRQMGMDMRTGAIIPSDVKPVAPAQLLKQLIVGSLDLKPRFLQLEKKAEVMVLFDACYSGDSAKFIAQLVSRNAELMPKGNDDLAALIDQAEASTGDWPYRNVVYISAAARHEPAWDISQKLVDAGQRKTIDNKAHGAFSNSLLSGLKGEADLDHNGKITYQELHQYLLETVQQRYGQTPQLSPKGLDNPATKKPLMARAKSPSAEGASDDAFLRVKVEPAADALAKQLAGDSNVRIVAKEYDVLAEASGSAYKLTHRSGGRMFYGPLSRAEALDRISNLGLAQKVMGLKYAAQAFNVNLAVELVDGSASSTEGVYPAGSILKMTMKPDRGCFLLLFNVDVEGSVTTIYPNRPADLREIKAGESVVAVESVVGAPFGTEGLKAIAFAKKPAGIESYVGKTLKGREELAALTELLKSGGSQTSRIVLSIPKQ